MNATTKAYNEKVRAELQKIKSQLAELEARSKAEDEQAAMELIDQLKATHHKVEKKRQEVERSAVKEMQQERAGIDAGIAKLKDGLADLDRRLNREPGATAS